MRLQLFGNLTFYVWQGMIKLKFSFEGEEEEDGDDEEHKEYLCELLNSRAA